MPEFPIISHWVRPTRLFNEGRLHSLSVKDIICLTNELEYNGTLADLLQLLKK